MVESLSAKEVIEYPNGGKSYFYVIDRTVVIVDEGENGVAVRPVKGLEEYELDTIQKELLG